MIDKNHIKLKIAKIIGSIYSYVDNPSYEQILEAIYDNVYKSIYKIPSDVFILGTIESFVIKNLDHTNILLISLKEVIQESLEISGLELTFKDDSWHNLRIEGVPIHLGNKYILSEKQRKSYMSEYFEI